MKSNASDPHDFKEIKGHMILRKFKAKIQKLRIPLGHFEKKSPSPLIEAHLVI